MPRQGDGSSDNGPIEAGQNVGHGIPTGSEKVDDHVARADKTAPLPEAEKGKGLSDANASGGQSQGIKKGPDVGQGGRSTTH
ncbi:hypothetical protein ACRE_065370 [Hapsidospora chrysogenum ATCC 11550]|uniref:Uncharacterized protein n=1 Tax=Hapsidospora chrysogenum (strain ATCC 11550 / CBS 779.69 / DSM 880 / IAM 14645 / JCM 23072 / IMI 49137) TaxID=857340 RepID=A0A086T016_HAPC1|nr:hypothetical protein ACRE_065370 [Hapsidospora chrysogenum ATCC 11550]